MCSSNTLLHIQHACITTRYSRVEHDWRFDIGDKSASTYNTFGLVIAHRKTLVCSRRVFVPFSLRQ